jgi:Fungal specific transcription factor domain
MTEQILQALSTDEKVPEILDRLKNGETYESIVEWLGRAPMDDFETLSPRLSQHSTFDASDHEMGGVSSSNVKWTTVTSNTVVLDHLFQLYFAWTHPVHTLFSEGHFVDSYKRQSEKYCSSNLVNAICAMACHLHATADGDDFDFDQLGIEFSDAVRADIDADDKSITTIQAFAVMFLVDCARGSGLRASAYLRVATSSLSKVDYLQNESFAEVWKNTVRGVRNLNVLVNGRPLPVSANESREWAQMTFQVPPLINSAIYNDIEEIDEEIDAAKWYFYRYVNDQCPAWPGLLATTNREKSKLTTIIQDVVTMMYTHYGPQISAHHLLQQYGRLVAWREDLPSVIGNIENNNSQALPHVLSLL